jgi:hypothetical protein
MPDPIEPVSGKPVPDPKPVADPKLAERQIESVDPDPSNPGTPVPDPKPAVKDEAKPKAEEKSLLGKDDADPEPKEEPKGKEKEEKPDEAADIEVKLPEGYSVDDGILAEFKALAKEAKLDSASAQKLIDLQIAQQEKARQADALQQKAWEKEITERPNYKEDLALAKRALVHVAPKGFRELVENSPLGSMPDVVDFLAKVGRMVQDDKLVDIEGGPAPIKTRMYPNMPST